MKKTAANHQDTNKQQPALSTKRWPTKYRGVKYRLARRIGFPGTEKIYYIIYKIAGQLFEEKVGRQYADSMTPEKAARIRGLKIECDLEPRRNTLNRTKKAAAQMKSLKAEFHATGNPLLALETLRTAHAAKQPPPKWAYDIVSHAIALYLGNRTNSLDHALGLNREGSTKPHRIPKKTVKHTLTTPKTNKNTKTKNERKTASPDHQPNPTGTP
jgi:hypothetical protein